MPAAKAKGPADKKIEITELRTTAAQLLIMGTEPLILNRMPVKAQREILLPGGRKTAAARSATLKHVPPEEFRDSPYRFKEPGMPTYLAFMGAAFRRAMGTAALDIPGAKRTQIERLTWIQGYKLPVYGIPELFMAVVRCADINRTPDIRTRAILPRWVIPVTVEFVDTLLTTKAVLNVLHAAGVTCGVGDWRTEKGSGRFGCFRVVDLDDEEALEIIEHGGRKPQLEAMANPAFYDEDTQDLYRWWEEEVAERGFNTDGTKKRAA